jgi:hypothetical protein
MAQVFELVKKEQPIFSISMNMFVEYENKDIQLVKTIMSFNGEERVVFNVINK